MEIFSLVMAMSVCYAFVLTMIAANFNAITITFNSYNEAAIEFILSVVASIVLTFVIIFKIGNEVKSKF